MGFSASSRPLIPCLRCQLPGLIPTRRPEVGLLAYPGGMLCSMTLSVALQSWYLSCDLFIPLLFTLPGMEVARLV